MKQAVERLCDSLSGWSRWRGGGTATTAGWAGATCTCRRGTLWEVEAREGGAEGRSKVFRFDSEDEARAFVSRSLEGPGNWRQLTVSTSTSTSTPTPAAGATAAEAPQQTDRLSQTPSHHHTG